MTENVGRVLIKSLANGERLNDNQWGLIAILDDFRLTLLYVNTSIHISDVLALII